MHIRRLENQDQQKIEAFLQPYKESSMFLLGNMHAVGVEYEDSFLHGMYWGVFDAEQALKGVLAHYWNGNIIVQAPSHEALDALTSFFCEHRVLPLAGILGPHQQVEHLIKVLSISSQDCAISRTEGLYSLSLQKLQVPKPVCNSRMHCVALEERHRDLVTAWMYAYELEALGADESDDLLEATKERSKRMLLDDRHRVLLVDDVPVSLCGRNATIDTCVQLGPVWTPVEQRRKGYARMLVALFLHELSEQGIEDAVLFTDNPYAIKAYEALGFMLIGDFNLTLLKQAIKGSNS